MQEDIQRKVDLLVENSKTMRSSAKLDFEQAANLGALLFTAKNQVAVEQEIRANRAILKSRAGILNNMRGAAANLSLLSRMAMADDPEEYLDRVFAAYESIKQSKVYRSESLVFTAMTMVDDTDPADYDAAASEAWATLEKMQEAHPLITSQEDLTLAHMLTTSGLDIDALLVEAERVYERLAPCGFKLNKDTVQSISIILALSDKPLEEKCDKFVELREALIAAKHRISGMELAVVAAFVDMDKPVDEIVAEIGEVDDALKHQRGFGALSCGGNLRRVYASALVLQAYDEEHNGVASVANGAVTQNIANIIVMTIITIIITMIIIMSINASSSH